MTQDFRQPGPREIGAAPAPRPTARKGPDGVADPRHPAGMPPPLQAQRLVLTILRLMALAFLLAGVVLLLQPQDWLPGGVGPFVGLALIFVALSDLAAARVLARVWARRKN